MTNRGRLGRVGALLLATFSVVIACSKEPSESKDPQRIGSAKVGAAGGVVASDDGTAVTIEIPPGALNEEQEITIAKVPDMQAPQVAGTVTAGTTIELGPEGLAFQQPVRVILAFDSAKRGASGAEIPTIFTAAKGASASAFVAMPTVGVDGTHVATTTTHFSWWTPVYVAQPTNVSVDAGADAETEADADAEADSAVDAMSDAASDASSSDGGTDHDGGGTIDPNCVPTTCEKQGTECGPQGDGCGGVIPDCGHCVAPDTCGGGGSPGKCGGGDSGSCVPKTCSDYGIECGNAGDGCGHLMACGTCEAPLTCAGVPGKCVNP
jgi:hypothetical protein